MPTQIDGGKADGLPDVAVRLPATPGSVSIARHAVLGLLDTVPVPGARMRDVVLAVSEAVTNAIQHGSPGRDAGMIELEIWGEEREITVSVRDGGGGITPRVSEEAIGLGLGLPIVIALSDEVRFSKRGTHFDVTMRFGLHEEPAS